MADNTEQMPLAAPPAEDAAALDSPSGPERRRKRCGGCGEAGHSKMTCPNADAPITRKGTVTCSTCNQPGHNSRKCPLKPRNTSVTCSSCGQIGHNCRTCPLKGSARKRQALGDESPAAHAGRVPSHTGDSGLIKAEAAADEGDALPVGGGTAAAACERLFGAARLMPPTSGDPFYLGPVRSDYVFPLPDSQADTVRMACTAAYRAWLGKIRLQTVEWLLPSKLQVGQDVYFDTIVAPSEIMLTALIANPGLQGPLQALRLPGPQPAGKWEGSRLTAFVGPTAGHLPELEALAGCGSPSRIIMAINPQWDAAPGSADAAAPFAAAAEPVFSFTSAPLGALTATVLRVFPGGWQIYMTPAGGSAEMVALDATRPTPARLAQLASAFGGSGGGGGGAAGGASGATHGGSPPPGDGSPRGGKRPFFPSRNDSPPFGGGGGGSGTPHARPTLTALAVTPSSNAAGMSPRPVHASPLASSSSRSFRATPTTTPRRPAAGAADPSQSPTSDLGSDIEALVGFEPPPKDPRALRFDFKAGVATGANDEDVAWIWGPPDAAAPLKGRPVHSSASLEPTSDMADMESLLRSWEEEDAAGGGRRGSGDGWPAADSALSGSEALSRLQVPPMQPLCVELQSLAGERVELLREIALLNAY